MKVILLKDVAKIGRRHQVVEVPDGFALNKLIPRKEAEPANAANLKRVNERNKNVQAVNVSEVSHLTMLETETSAIALEVPMDANEQGHLFQSVHVSDIVLALGLRALTVAEGRIAFTRPIKTLGAHIVLLQAGGTSKKLNINVVAKQK